MRIGEALVQEGLITPDELDAAIQEQSRENERLGSIVMKKGFVSEENMAFFIARYFNIPFVRLKDKWRDINPEVLKFIPENLANRFKIMPIFLEDNVLTIAMADPIDYLAMDTIKMKTGYRINPVVSSEKDIVESIEYCYHQACHMRDYIDDFIASEAVLPEKANEVKKMQVEASDPPVVQYVNSLIIQAVNSDASDIHLKPKQDKVALSFRVDGVLHQIDPPPKKMFSAIISRIKILANLDIAERRLPQDGRFKLSIGKDEIDVRVSCFPTLYGESIVMRILNARNPLFGLEQIGFIPDVLEKFKDIIHRSYGLILITGPTGSGKTTTLYSALDEIKSKEKNMITLEDPVEYRLPFLTQSQVNPLIGFDFARGLRSILRQDPDLIMVGEIRDKETAEVAIHAALTGHLVLSTLHTNDASSAPVRLINMGIEPFLISSALLGVLAQRLVRSICSDCRKEYPIKNDLLNKLSLTQEITSCYRGEGCPKCFNSGYKGRIGIFELLIINEAIRNLIISRCSSEEIQAVAVKNGMKTLRESGIEKIKSGITSPEEIIRVTQLTEE